MKRKRSAVALDGLGVLDLLQADRRPTLVLDLHADSNANGLRASFRNESFLSSPALCEAVISPENAACAFRVWMLSSATSGNGKLYDFHGMKWIQYTVSGRWRVISAMEEASAQEASATGHITIGGVTNSFITTTAEFRDGPGPLTSLLEPPSPSDGRKSEREALSRSKHWHPGDSWPEDFHRLLKAMMADTHVVEMATIGMFEVLPSGILLQANDNWYNTSGYPRDPSVSAQSSFMERVYKDDLALVKEKWSSLERGIPVTFEMRWKGKSSAGGKALETEPTWISAACMPVMSNDGMLTSISGFTTDISASKRDAQNMLERARILERAESSELRFAKFAELAPVAIFILDVHKIMHYCNDKWFDMVGCPRMEFQKIEWAQYIFQEDMHIIEESWNLMTDGKSAATFEFRLNRPWNGAGDSAGQTWVMASGYPEMARDGSVHAVLGTMTEISKYKWAESVEKSMKEEAIEAKRQQENFIDMTSHELRNPLSAVVQCAESTLVSLDQISQKVNVLATGQGNFEKDELPQLFESSSEAIQTILTCSMHQRRIIDDILTLSKLDSRLLVITPVQVQPVSVVQEALKMFEVQARNADVALSYEENESLAQYGIDWVMIDPSRVLQVLINLLTNAIKFTRLEAKRDVKISIKASTRKPPQEEGYIERRTPLKDDEPPPDGDDVYLHFVVRDTGRGLSSDEQARLFHRFAQASPRTHVKYGGSGLGLFVSRELAELQGGAIRVASESKGGSTFAFYVKCRRAKRPANETLMLPPLQNNDPGYDSSSINQLSILIVEDNLVNQRVLATQLEKLQCQVAIAGHGQAALDFLTRTKFYRGNEERGQFLSLVLMDIEMPVMGGLECVRAIRELEENGEIIRHIPVIAVSANARKEQIDAATSAGMDDFITKPFRVSELLPKMMRLAGQNATLVPRSR